MDVAIDVAMVRIGFGVLPQCANIHCRVDRGARLCSQRLRKILVADPSEDNIDARLASHPNDLKTVSCPEHDSCPLQPVVYLLISTSVPLQCFWH